MPLFTVDIELDKPRKMAFTLRAMKAFRERPSVFASAKPVDPEHPTPQEELAMGDIVIDNIPFMLVHLLKHDDPSITEEQVMDMIDMHSIPYVSQKITDLMSGSAPESKGEAKGGSPLAQPSSSTGTT